MPWKPYSHRKRKLIAKLKAQKIAEVVQETGKIDLVEAYRRYKPYLKPESVTAHWQQEMDTEEVMDEVEKMLEVTDKDFKGKINVDFIIQDLLSDIQLLNQLKEAGKLNANDVIKILTAKNPKIELLGKALGIWKQEKPQEREKTAQELMQELGKLQQGGAGL
jgi:hypothetical protein